MEIRKLLRMETSLISKLQSGKKISTRASEIQKKILLENNIE